MADVEVHFYGTKGSLGMLYSECLLVYLCINCSFPLSLLDCTLHADFTKSRRSLLISPKGSPKRVLCLCEKRIGYDIFCLHNAYTW